MNSVPNATDDPIINWACPNLLLAVWHLGLRILSALRRPSPMLRRREISGAPCARCNRVGAGACRRNGTRRNHYSVGGGAAGQPLPTMSSTRQPIVAKLVALYHPKTLRTLLNNRWLFWRIRPRSSLRSPHDPATVMLRLRPVRPKTYRDFSTLVTGIEYPLSRSRFRITDNRFIPTLIGIAFNCRVQFQAASKVAE